MYIDKSNIDKVAYNLLSNAFKYTPANGKVEVNISINKLKQQLIIKVIDTGVGIPKIKEMNYSTVLCKAVSPVIV